jgi:adenylosuccinate lyase
MDAAKKIKEEGGDNDLLDRLKADPAFAVVADQIDDLVNPVAFIGRAPEQVTEFLASRIQPLLAKWKNELADSATEEIAV